MKDLELQFRSFNKQTWDFLMFFHGRTLLVAI